MFHRTVIFLGILFLGVAYKHQQLDRMIGVTSRTPKEITNPTVEGLAQFKNTETESLNRIKSLIESGSIHTPNQFGTTPLLFAACQNGDPQVVEYLYTRGARLQDRDLYGTTALMCAAESGNLRLLSWLIDRGARINQRNRLGQTALYFAAREGKYQTVKALLNKGATFLMKDYMGKTPQYVAVKNRHVKIADLLKVKPTKSRSWIRPVY